MDIVVHNVGGSSAPSGGFITVTDELWRQAFDENLGLKKGAGTVFGI